MSNATYSSASFARAARPGKSLLAQAFAATPLYLFVTAVKAALASKGNR